MCMEIRNSMSQNEEQLWECDICGATHSTHGNPFTLDTVTQHVIDKHATPPIPSEEEEPIGDDIPKYGYWYEIIDFSERDYGNDWGFYGYKDGKRVYSSGGIYSRIRLAGDAARDWKKEQMRKTK